MWRLTAAVLLAAAGCSAPDALPGGDVVTVDAGDAGAFPGSTSDGGILDGGVLTDAGVDGGSDAGIIPAPYWANTQYPPWATADAGAAVSVYGQVWIDGRTGSQGATPGLLAEVGLGPAGTAPTDPAWSWSTATFNVDVGNNDEFRGTVVAPADGVYDYAFRYQLTGVTPWSGFLYADRSDNGRAGTHDGYSPDNAGRLSVRLAGAKVLWATLNLHCLRDDPAARLDAAAAGFASLGVDAVALQEVCEGAPVTNTAQHLAFKLSAATGRPWKHLFVQTHLANGTTPEGLGIITWLPIAQTNVQDLATADFPRKALLAVLASRAGTLGFVSTHLSFASTAEAAQARLDAANAIVALADSWRPTLSGFIVSGDFNAVPTDPPISAMTSGAFVDAWAAKNGAAAGYTHTSTNPTRRIDYLFVRDLAVDSCALEFDQPYAPGSYVSDHRGVSARAAAP